ncbi:MAG TPA: hypothetical protein VL921_15460 [Candidatus Udaeobacter sp.]|nr:hypothetical protein [Candidatus Udaeobacter sp.]
MDKKSFDSNKRWGFMRFIVAAVCIAAISLTLFGCGSNKQDKLKTYGHDGYMGYSNSNPNLPNRHQYLNYNADGNFVEQVLEPISEIERTQVYFNGNDLHVNIKVNKAVSDGQLERLRAKAQSIVQYNMPRYNVHVEAKR